MSKLSQFFKRIWPKKSKPERIDLVYPVSWDQMDYDDLRNVCQIIDQPISNHDKLFLCLCKLAHITPDDPRLYEPKAIKDKMPFVIGGKRYIIGASVIEEACFQLRFIFEDKEGLPPCPFKNVHRLIYGISFEQYFAADSFILRYVAENNGSYLKEAAKILTNGQKRKFLPWERTAFIIWWNGVKRQLLKKYPYVLEEGGGISNKSQADILQELLSIVNNDRPQDNEQILKTDVHAVMFQLNKIYEDAKRKAAK